MLAHFTKGGVLTGHAVSQIGLNKHKHHQHKDDDHKQCGQRIDKAGPGKIFNAASVAKPCKCHAYLPRLAIEEVPIKAAIDCDRPFNSAARISV